MEWAIEVAQRWVDKADPLRKTFTPYMGSAYLMATTSTDTPAMDELRALEHQTARVIQRALHLPTEPELLVAKKRGEVEIEAGIDLAKRALGVLKTSAETEEMLGSNAPTMEADALHPLIWDAASKHWEVDHYAAAVQRAATMLNADIQDRVGRHDVSDGELMRESFSLADPAPGKSRLRWPGDDSDLSVRAMRVGILNLAQGVFSAIRNPATHSTDDMARQEALEQLATLSILARWVDRCELEA